MGAENFDGYLGYEDDEHNPPRPFLGRWLIGFLLLILAGLLTWAFVDQIQARKSHGMGALFVVTVVVYVAGFGCFCGPMRKDEPADLTTEHTDSY